MLSVLKHQFKIKNKFIFLISPIDDELNSIYEALKTIGRELEFQIVRIDKIEGDFRITDVIIEMIKESKLIISDLSYERPNCYYELGYARALGKSVITIARKGTNLHFDVKDYNCIFYENSTDLKRKLRKRLKVILEILSSEN